MYRSFILVGLGGSGGKTLRFVKRELAARLAEKGWDNGIPDAWQFLHIDTPTVADGHELNDSVDQLAGDEYFGLVGDGMNFDAVTAQLDNTPGLDAEMVGWRIDPNLLEVPITMGAGQFRAVGRSVAMVQGRQIRNRLTTSFRRVSSPAARAELAQCFTTTHPSLLASDVPLAPIVIVVSSLAGGTGAGLLMNVCDLIKETNDCEGVFGFLYTPEVFGAMGGVGDGVFPNSLAALSEILNGYWWHGDPAARGNAAGFQIPTRNTADLTQAGASKPIKDSGPDYPFLIGLENANGNSFANATELFGAMGSALATTMTDIGLQNSLIAYEITNWQNLAQQNTSGTDVLVSGDNSGLLGTQGHAAFQGLGTARLSIGLDFFEKYSAQRAAKDVSKYIALAHVNSDAAKQAAAKSTTNDPAEIAELIADGLLEHFLNSTELAELGPDRDQVKDRIRPDDGSLGTMMADARSTAIQLSEIESGGKSDSSGWGLRIADGVYQAKKQYSSQYRDNLQTNVHRWVARHSEKVLEVVEDFISRHGIIVTTVLLKQTASYLLNPNGVVEELRGPNELEKFNDWSSDSYVRQGLAAPLQGLGSRIDAGHAALRDALEEGLHLMHFVGEAQVCDQAAALLDSFTQFFLRPLADALEREAQLLNTELKGEAANWAEWNDGEPPTGLQPNLSEVTLIEPDEFGSTFDSLLVEMYADEAEPEMRRIRCREDIVAGNFLVKSATSASNQQHAIQISVPWSPGTAVDPNAIVAQSAARFRVMLRPTLLYDRAQAWMRQPNCAFDKLLSSTLRTYLGDDPVFPNTIPPAELAKRQQRFEAKLRQVFDVSAPLIGISPTLAGIIHDGIQHKISISQLPFRNHDLEKRVGSLLEARDLSSGSLLDDNPHTSHVTLVSRFKEPVSPLIVTSLLRPISEDWAIKSNSQVGRGHFWSRRRARRLDQFVPVPQEILAAMCRGWFVGVALGIIDRTSEPITIGRPDEGPVAFPYPALSSSANHRDQLAIVLESLALAYVQVNQFESLAPLDAYLRLRDLGVDHDVASNLYTYDVGTDQVPKLGRDLEEWVRNGVAPGQVTTRLAQGSDERERLTSVLDVFVSGQTAYRDELAELEASWSKNPASLGKKPYWPGLHLPISDALRSLAVAVEHRLEHLDNKTGHEGL
jgi:hypothetical protein